jgi:hypothetical protein
MEASSAGAALDQQLKYVKRYFIHGHGGHVESRCKCEKNSKFNLNAFSSDVAALGFDLGRPLDSNTSNANTH